MRHFIIQYQACNGETGIQYVASKSLEGLRHKMWMLKKAKVVEVEPTEAWEWDGEDLKPTRSTRLYPRQLKATH